MPPPAHRLKVLIVLGLCAIAPAADAAEEPRGFAPDGFTPASTGSAWFVADALDLRGAARPALGIVGDYTRRRLALRSPTGITQPTPVRDALYAHLGASVVLADRVRLGGSVPLQLFVDGAARAGDPLPSPPTEQGVGDVRVDGDVRLFGTYGDRLTVAAGIQGWLPTGSTAQFAGDGDWRVRPRAMLAGEIGAFVYAAEVGARYRGRSETVGGVVLGSDVGVTLAAGARLLDRKVLVGAEVFGSTVLAEPLGRASTPIEVLLSGRYAVGHEVRVGAGIGTGLHRDFGPPALRALVTIEWVPPVDATPSAPAAGAPTAEPACADGVARPGCPATGPTEKPAELCGDGPLARPPGPHGCAPDEDGDGVDDLSDACPTVPGVRTDSPDDNGCPSRDPDADGIVNELDACPHEAGLKDPDPRRSGCPLVYARGDALELRVPLSFAERSADVSGDATNLAVLGALARYLHERPELRVRVEGHTHDRASGEASAKLGAERAEAVIRWLTAQHVEGARLEGVGVGSARPLRSNETETGRRANERIELHVVR